MTDQKKLDILSRISKALEGQVELEARNNALKGESITILEREALLLASREKVYDKIESILEATGETQVKMIKSMDEMLDKEQRRGEITNEYYREYKVLLAELSRAQRENDQAEQDSIRKRIDGLRKLDRQQRKNIETLKKGQQTIESMTETMAGLAGISTTAADSIMNIVKSLAQGKKGAAALGSALVGGIGKALNPVNLLMNGLGKAGEYMFQFNAASAEFASFAGRSGGFMDSVETARAGVAGLGVTLAEAAQANLGLYASFTRFSHLTEGDRVGLVKLASLMQNLGTSADTTGQILNFMTVELGMMTRDAAASIRDLNEESIKLGIGPSELNQSLLALSPRLADFGTRGISIFREFARAAKQMGFDIDTAGSKLFAASEQMMTFEGSARVAADLAVLLGGNYVNAFELTMAAQEGPQAQFDLLQQAVRRSSVDLRDQGLFFNQMLGQLFPSLSSGEIANLLTGKTTFEALQTQDPALAGALGGAVPGETKAPTLMEASLNTTTIAELQKITMESIGAKAAGTLAAAVGLPMSQMNLMMQQQMSNLINKINDPGDEEGMSPLMMAVTALGTLGSIASISQGFKGLSKLKNLFGKKAPRSNLLPGFGQTTKPGFFAGLKGKAGSLLTGARNLGGKGLGMLKNLPKSGKIGLAVSGAAGLGSMFMGGEAEASPAFRDPNAFSPVDLKNTGASADFIEGGAGQSELSLAGDIGSFFLPLIGPALKFGAEMGVSAMDLGPGQLPAGAVGLGQRSKMAGGTPARFTADMFSSDPRFAKQIEEMKRREAAAGLTRGDVETAMTNALAKNSNLPPIQVDLYIDKTGTGKIASQTIKHINRNYN